MNRDLFFNARSQFQPRYQFESAVSSIVSSPVSVSNDMGLNLPIMDHLVKENFPKIRNSMPIDPNLQLLAEDPGFAERAAKFSCFNGRSNEFGLHSNKTEALAKKIDRSLVENKNLNEMNVKSNRLSSSGANSAEESSLSEQISTGDLGFKNRKRKGQIGSTTAKGEIVDGSKKLKKTEEEKDGGTMENTKASEPSKDYIHVRARRGQATDSHSLAERVRREKISQRMKLLQSLVPNCNKVTGKTIMLDEIINYVQSLQRQVEFLSMKLATLNPNPNFATNDIIISQNINQLNVSLCQLNHQQLFNESALMTQYIHESTEPFRDFRAFGEDDLQSIVRMGFDRNLNLDTTFFHMAMEQPSNMKTEF